MKTFAEQLMEQAASLQAIRCQQCQARVRKNKDAKPVGLRCPKCGRDYDPLYVPIQIEEEPVRVLTFGGKGARRDETNQSD